MSLCVSGIGLCLAEEAIDGLYPHKEYMPKQFQRMSSRLARMVYVAASRALQDAGINAPVTMPIIAGTAMSEIDAGIELIQQIDETKGSAVSPTLVQNSVTNAPFSLLSIGLKDTGPVITLSHSFLSPEAALEYAGSFLIDADCEKVMLVAGDQYLQKWAELLKHSQVSAMIHQEHLKEGVIALILTQSKQVRYPVEIKQSRVFSLASGQKTLPEMLSKFGFTVFSHTQIYIKKICQQGLQNLEKTAILLGVPSDQVRLTQCSLASPLADIVELVKARKTGHYLFIGSEFNDVSAVEIEITSEKDLA